MTTGLARSVQTRLVAHAKAVIGIVAGIAWPPLVASGVGRGFGGTWRPGGPWQ